MATANPPPGPPPAPASLWTVPLPMAQPFLSSGADGTPVSSVFATKLTPSAKMYCPRKQLSPVRCWYVPPASSRTRHSSISPTFSCAPARLWWLTDRTRSKGLSTAPRSQESHRRSYTSWPLRPWWRCCACAAGWKGGPTPWSGCGSAARRCLPASTAGIWLSPCASGSRARASAASAGTLATAPSSAGRRAPPAATVPKPPDRRLQGPAPVRRVRRATSRVAPRLPGPGCRQGAYRGPIRLSSPTSADAGPVAGAPRYSEPRLQSPDAP